MENANCEVNLEKINDSGVKQRIESFFTTFSLTPAKLRSLAAFTFASFLGCGLRSVCKHTRGQKLHNIRSGFALGLRALGIATVLSVSSVGLLIVGVSAALNVSSFGEFNIRMTNLCGERFRIDKRESVASFSEVLKGPEKKS